MWVPYRWGATHPNSSSTQEARIQLKIEKLGSIPGTLSLSTRLMLCGSGEQKVAKEGYPKKNDGWNRPERGGAGAQKMKGHHLVGKGMGREESRHSTRMVARGGWHT